MRKNTTNTTPTPYPADMYEGRCYHCDSRYCWDGCYADVPGYYYCVGFGYKPEAVARDLFARGLTCRVDGLDLSRETTSEDIVLSATMIQGMLQAAYGD